VERHESSNPGSLRDVTGLTRSKMPSLCGNVRIRVDECRLNEKLVGAARECDDPINVFFMIGGVHHVSDLLSTRCAQRVCA
jgi:hypothetical protein